MQGREAIYEWISKTMARVAELRDEGVPARLVRVRRRARLVDLPDREPLRDPGDGKVYEAYNLTVLKYAGDMQFSSEEDAYNPANFAPVVKAWIEASARRRKS